MKGFILPALLRVQLLPPPRPSYRDAFMFFAVGGDVCRALGLLQRADGVSQVPLLRPPLPFERPGLPHGAATAADLLAPQRSAHASLGSRQLGRRAASHLPSATGTSKVENQGLAFSSRETV